MKNLGFNLVKGKIHIELAIPVPYKIFWSCHNRFELKINKQDQNWVICLLLNDNFLQISFYLLEEVKLISTGKPATYPLHMYGWSPAETTACKEIWERKGFDKYQDYSVLYYYNCTAHFSMFFSLISKLTQKQSTITEIPNPWNSNHFNSIHQSSDQ